MQGLICGKPDESDVYMDLIHRFPLKPIKNDDELGEAMQMLDALLECDTLSVEAEEYFTVLQGLIEKYEKEHHAIPPVPDHDLLRHLIDAKGVTQIEVARATGIIYTTISAVLAGRRQLTREQIGLLARYFKVSVDTFSFQ